QLGRIQPCSSESFPTAGGVLILAYLEMSARRGHSGEKLGRALPSNRLWTFASQVVRMIYVVAYKVVKNKLYGSGSWSSRAYKGQVDQAASTKNFQPSAALLGRAYL